MALCGQIWLRDEDALRVHFFISCFADIAPLGILIVKKREKGKNMYSNFNLLSFGMPNNAVYSFIHGSY